MKGLEEEEGTGAMRERSLVSESSGEWGEEWGSQMGRKQQEGKGVQG